jgi:hypothetical protein
LRALSRLHSSSSSPSTTTENKKTASKTQ